MENKSSRVYQIMSAFTAFTEQCYSREQLLPELFKLQSELSKMTFNDTHAENADLRIWDVEEHLEKLNEEFGHPADEALNRFKDKCKVIKGSISRLNAGKQGEDRAHRSIETIRRNKRVLRNVEYKDAGHRTELDEIVFSGKTVFIVEVKNPRCDITIDERGNYYSHGKTATHFDGNIGEKMNNKEFLLREAFRKAGIEMPKIVSLVCFTNSSAHVDNRYSYVRDCYLCSLPHIIEELAGEEEFEEDVLEELIEAAQAAECKDAYPAPVDMKQFKEDFAVVMTLIETASFNRDNPRIQETTSKSDARATEAADEAKTQEPSVISTALFVGVSLLAGAVATYLLGRNGHQDWRK